MIDAAVRPDVAHQGETVRLVTHIQSNSRQALQLVQWALLRGERGPVAMFRPRPVALRPGDSVTSSFRYVIPEDLPAGRYVFEAFIGPSPARPIDRSSAELVVRPRPNGGE